MAANEPVKNALSRSEREENWRHTMELMQKYPLMAEDLRTMLRHDMANFFGYDASVLTRSQPVPAAASAAPVEVLQDVTVEIEALEPLGSSEAIISAKTPKKENTRKRKIGDSSDKAVADSDYAPPASPARSAKASLQAAESSTAALAPTASRKCSAEHSDDAAEEPDAETTVAPPRKRRRHSMASDNILPYVAIESGPPPPRHQRKWKPYELALLQQAFEQSSYLQPETLARLRSQLRVLQRPHRTCAVQEWFIKERSRRGLTHTRPGTVPTSNSDSVFSKANFELLNMAFANDSGLQRAKIDGLRVQLGLPSRAGWTEEEHGVKWSTGCPVYKWFLRKRYEQRVAGLKA